MPAAGLGPPPVAMPGIAEPAEAIEVGTGEGDVAAGPWVEVDAANDQRGALELVQPATRMTTASAGIAAKRGPSRCISFSRWGKTAINEQ